MSKPTKSEWQQAVELLNCCIATISCGCTVNEDEKFWVESLYRNCEKMMMEIETERPDLIP